MKNKTTAILLAFFLGGIGVHKFYLDRPGAGAVYLIFFWTLIPSLLALIDFIILVSMSQESFDRQYNFQFSIMPQAPIQATQNVVVHIPQSSAQPNQGNALQGQSDLVQMLTQLNNLRTSGALTDDEFNTQKAKLLNTEQRE